MRPKGWLLASLLVVSPAIAVAQTETGSSIKEVFHMSRVGKANATETREGLASLYALVAAKHDAAVERERAALKEAYRERRVRIQGELNESDAHGRLYFGTYKGATCVFSLAGENWTEGELTPALNLEEDGSHETTVTSNVLGKARSLEEKPNREVAGGSGGEGVSLFGLRLDFDDGSSKRIANPAAAQNKSIDHGKIEIMDRKSFPKYRATVSIEVPPEGPPLMSPALLHDLVKGGKTFTVKRSEVRRCNACIGFGRVTDTVRKPGSRDPDGKMTCPDCGGAGSRELEVTYVLTW